MDENANAHLYSDSNSHLVANGYGYSNAHSNCNAF
jgi:hypothetical protein